MATLIQQISAKLTEEEKENIPKCLRSIEHKQENQKQSLIHLFEYWRKYLPSVKQSIMCNSCQKAVIRFWTQVNNKMNE